MATWIIVIVLALVLLCAVFVWRVWRRKRALKVLIRHNQRRCDEMVAQALSDLHWQYLDPLRSEPVADVWGHGIMAFEYALAQPSKPIARDAFEQALRQQSAAQNTTGAKLAPSLIVTDWWARDGMVHADVAYVMNAATREYVQDVRRV